MTTFNFPGSRENLKRSTEDTESSSLGEDDQPSEEEKILTDLMVGFVGTQDNEIYLMKPCSSILTSVESLKSLTLNQTMRLKIKLRKLFARIGAPCSKSGGNPSQTK